MVFFWPAKITTDTSAHIHTTLGPGVWVGLSPALVGELLREADREVGRDVGREVGRLEPTCKIWRTVGVEVEGRRHVKYPWSECVRFVYD